MKDDSKESQPPQAPPSPEAGDKGAGDELKEGLRHLFSAARKVMKSAEPAVSRSLEDAERVFGKLGRGGEAVAAEVGREVATLATRLADKLRSVADRAEGNVPDERTPPAPPVVAEESTSGAKDPEDKA